MTAALPVTLYGHHLGELTRTSDGARLQWSRHAESHFGLNATVLSRSLRVGVNDAALTESFFGNLLPEGIHLDRLATRVQVASNDVVGLLAAVGADLAGALRVGTEEPPGDPETLDRAQIIALLDNADGFLVGGGGSALPGFQRKLTLTRENGVWLRGNGSLPSTHILKPVPTDLRAAVDQEAYVLEIARAAGLLEYETRVEAFGDRTVLVVERFDRRRSASGTIERIHQEDMAQALGLPWGGDDKFERANPRANLRAIAGQLDSRSTVFDPQPDADRQRLLRYLTVSVAVGNSDAHAKNYSILHGDGGGEHLAPYYDAAPLALAYDGSPLNALTINGQRQLADTTRDDLTSEAEGWGVGASLAASIVDETLHAVIEATRTVNAPDSIRRHVPGYIRGQAENLRAGRPARIPSAVPLASLPFLGTPETS